MEAANDNRVGFIVAGLLLGMVMGAMDNTIVATAMGTIVANLGGFEKFVWVTSSYMVAMLAGTPIFGKLSDMYGRKIFFLSGLSLFLVGSALCGTANSMTQLSIYRAIQGLGSGAIMPIAFTIMFDIFPPEKRGKMSGLFGAVFGASSIFGPFLGAVITETISWRWIFYVNVPLGILSIVLITIFYRESQMHAKQKIDWWGAVTLVIAIVCLMFALQLGGNSYPWTSPSIIGLFLGFFVLTVLFLYVETKASEPIISFAMFKNRLFATSVAASLFVGASFITATVYIPIFVQGVLGGTATIAGFILTPMTLGSIAGGQIGGLLTTKTSYRNVMIAASIFFFSGMLLLATLKPDSSRLLVTFYMILTGFGLGFSFTVLSMSSIHSFDMRKRGSATSARSFLQTLGMTLGITVFGIVQRGQFTKKMAEAFVAGGGPVQGVLPGDVRSLLTPEGRARVPKEILHTVGGALSSSITQTFMWALIPTSLAVLFILLMSNERMPIPVKAALRQSEQK